MKIALVIDRFDPGRGGGEGYAVALARGLARRGHDVHVFSQSWADGSERIRFHRLPLIPYPRWAKIASLAISGCLAIRSGEFDLIQGFGGVPNVDVHRPGGGAERAWLRQEIRSRGRGLHRLAMALRRCLSPKVLINLLIEKHIYGQSSGPVVVANSDKVRIDILRFYEAMPPSRIRVIRNGVDLERFHPKNRGHSRRRFREKLSLPGEAVFILFLAHNFWLKGLHCLMRALGERERVPGNWFLLIGGRGNRGPFQRLADRLGIGERTVFLGPVRDPAAVLGTSDILVHPTFYDPFSNVCLEGMASGLPVITTSQNGAGELIEDAVSGYVIPDPWSVDLLAQRILTLMAAETREAMGLAARKVAEDFPWHRHLHEMEVLYNEVLEGR